VTVVSAIGWFGALALLSAYSLLTIQRIVVRSSAYGLLNAAGSLALVINGTAHSAWPSVALNVVWLVIAATGTSATLLHQRRCCR
jgi:hypothetical protein